MVKAMVSDKLQLSGGGEQEHSMPGWASRARRVVQSQGRVPKDSRVLTAPCTLGSAKITAGITEKCAGYERRWKERSCRKQALELENNPTCFQQEMDKLMGRRTGNNCL